MRTRQEINEKAAGLSRRLAATCQHDHTFSARELKSAQSATCPCWNDWHTELTAFEACVPKKFWKASRADVHRNLECFDEVIVPYTSDASLRIALSEGAGLFLVGANGCGKSMFLSYILMDLIRNRNVTVYYTNTLTLAKLIKRGFNDKEVESELARLMLRNFVVIDELGKEQFKAGDSFLRREIEEFIRARSDGSLPTLLASNASLETLSAPYDDGGYGSTFGSLIAGSYTVVQMESGDYRTIVGNELQARMMG